MTKKVNIQIDNLKIAFLEAKERLLTETEAIKNNFTETFFETLKDKINHRELIIIAVRGEVRTGKSSIVMELVRYINQYIADIGLNKEPINNLSKYIFSDQTEFLRFINGEERNAAIAIDEFNGMATTGLNATTEEALYDHYSSVFAGQYLHRITASPDIITDKNTNIILDVIGKDEESRTIRCKLIYREIATKMHMTIGHVDINVGKVINNWIKSGAREIIESKGIKTIGEKEFIEKIKKEDFYVRYQIKKYERMDLLKKHGVRDIRDLEFSTLILEVLLELQDYSKIKKPTKELVDTIVDEVCKRNKRIYSMLTINEIGQRARAILNIYYEVNNLEKKSRNKNLTLGEEVIINKTIKQTEELLEKRLKQQEDWAEIYKKYMGIK